MFPATADPRPKLQKTPKLVGWSSVQKVSCFDYSFDITLWFILFMFYFSFNSVLDTIHDGLENDQSETAEIVSLWSDFFAAKLSTTLSVQQFVHMLR